MCPFLCFSSQEGSVIDDGVVSSERVLSFRHGFQPLSAPMLWARVTWYSPAELCWLPRLTSSGVMVNDQRLHTIMQASVFRDRWWGRRLIISPAVYSRDRQCSETGLPALQCMRDAAWQTHVRSETVVACDTETGATTIRWGRGCETRDCVDPRMSTYLICRYCNGMMEWY